ncbi:MAG TPA: DUF1080 domain-containing protein [Candidatus Hydrogenedentes bacterium]|nr:DUF1080 domain-containing protein [Candidatus Hydrogenedentota bacterium]HPG69794.1 DUF1080 domain-containing protein [Candidatus Hydrogenedentota bacterium]
MKPRSVRAAASFLAVTAVLLAACSSLDTEIAAEDGNPSWLETWQPAEFSDPGRVHVEAGTLVLEAGRDLTGARWRDMPARMNYEIRLEAMRVEGDDFFCGLTFPVNDAPCTLIVGGWHGGTVGLSSLDYEDAASNDTTQYMTFENGRWYRIRLRVTAKRIQAWIDGQSLIDVSIEGRVVGIRHEMEPSRPLGIASWRTTAAIRNIVFEPLE